MYRIVRITSAIQYNIVMYRTDWSRRLLIPRRLTPSWMHSQGCLKKSTKNYGGSQVLYLPSRWPYPVRRHEPTQWRPCTSIVVEAGHFRSIVRASYVSEIVLTSLHSLTCFLISLDGIYFTPMQDDGREPFELGSPQLGSIFSSGLVLTLRDEALQSATATVRRFPGLKNHTPKVEKDDVIPSH